MSAAKKERFVKMLWNLLSVCSHNTLTLARAACKYLSQHQRIARILKWGEAENVVLHACGATMTEVSRFFQQSHAVQKETAIN